MTQDESRADPSSAGLAPLRLLGLTLPRRGVIVLGIMLGIFLSALEGTVVGTALPTITGELHGLELFGYVVTGYLVTATVSVPAWGRLSDLYGRRPFYLAGIAIFLVGSALSGLVPLPVADPRTGEIASTMPWLIAARAVQGLGAGAITPIGFTMVADIFDVEERAKVQGWLSSVWGLSSVAGPPAGGLIVAHLGWRWVFYLNIPFGILAALLVGVAWSEPARERRGRLRVLPLLLLTGSLGFALLAIGAISGREAAAAWLAPASGAVALVTGVAFVLLERRAETPVLDLSLFSGPMFRAVGIGAPFAGICMFASISFVPLFVQGSLGRSAQDAGFMLAFLFVPWMLGSVFSPTLALKVGLRRVSLVGGVLVVVGYVPLARAGVTTSYEAVAISVALVGAGMGLTVAPQMIAVQTSVERARRGAATALTQFARSLGGTLGVAVIGAVLASGLVLEVRRLAPGRGIGPERVLVLEKRVDDVVRPHAPGGTASAPELTKDERAVLEESLATALGHAFSIALGASVIFLLANAILPKDMKPGKDLEAAHAA